MTESTGMTLGIDKTEMPRIIGLMMTTSTVGCAEVIVPVYLDLTDPHSNLTPYPWTPNRSHGSPDPLAGSVNP